jgi:parvulin-like peptidyl-prolyl isomerase
MSTKSVVHDGTGASVGPDALRTSVLEQLISEVLLLQGAADAGVTVTEGELAAELERIKKRSGEERFRKYLDSSSLTEEEYTTRLWKKMMRDRFIDTMIFSGQIPEEEIKDFYKDSPMPFMTSEMVELRIMEFESQEEAEAAIKEMRSIEKNGFDKVARRLSSDDRIFVSQYGETNPSFYPGEVGSAMKELGEGEFGGPYKGKEGFFLVRVRKRIPERPKTFVEARQEIKAMLLDRRRTAAVIHWVANKKNSSTIVWN